ncbi:type IV pilin N-terminal domain-containing protein [Methanospirillum hungatei]|uniref:type IV pilin N-terminal domain-containing protein n=1 Tax=Methanospirillum hungatei TaxID=2203 RepID=UPI0026EE5A7A|nr:type IV pilin N-terminal domain-containing protein [Methanospirillum hungatei]MCA1916918.1 type IV pilin N-terminal domain-containing protein [Methanospirillum hungatei]
MREEPAVSAVLSEVLMISLVLILVPIVTISLMNQLPEDRVPTVNIKMSPITNNNVTFYHKGGDWIKFTDIRILQNGRQISFMYDKPVFDLGDHITVSGVIQNARIDFVAKNSIIFSGVPQS